ncbi:MAG: response regulator transcription factor [Acidobacteria bacterium]|nr:response regulator transcription factor [Acidobacteriota bacterium]MBV8890858.1 response regulator transcription factor [Acidobacteriota bacterium]MBV9482834.1 response regulator transcription factor [Acidobacteriota bacterium]
MASIPVNVEEDGQKPGAREGTSIPIRVILADSQAIFRAGLRKVFALEDDIRVIGQAETYSQALSAIQKFSSDIVMFESALADNPSDAVAEMLRLAPIAKLVVITEGADEELTLELFRRGAHGIVSREVEPEMLVECLHKVARGEPWLESQAVNWVLEAYRTQATRPAGARAKVQLTPKESLIVSCVTQGMKNKEIAARVGTTEQVVKNYLRKVYDKLGVADRLELALYCLQHRVLDGQEQPPSQAAAAAAGAGQGVKSEMSAPPLSSTENIS